MPKLVRYGATALSGLAVALFLAVSPALAEMEVLESSVPGLEPGTALADDATLKLPDGGETRASLMIAAEAAVAAIRGEGEEKWRYEWTRRLVRLAVKWQDEPTTEGVVSVLGFTDAVIAKLKSAAVWPWRGKEAKEPKPKQG